MKKAIRHSEDSWGRSVLNLGVRLELVVLGLACVCDVGTVQSPYCDKTRPWEQRALPQGDFEGLTLSFRHKCVETPCRLTSLSCRFAV